MTAPRTPPTTPPTMAPIFGPDEVEDEFDEFPAFPALGVGDEVPVVVGEVLLVTLADWKSALSSGLVQLTDELELL